MSDLLIGALVALAFALLSLRPVNADTRTWADYRARARRAGWAGCVLGTLRVALVAALLVLNDACRLCLKTLQGARVVLGALSCAVMQAGRPAIGGAA